MKTETKQKIRIILLMILVCCAAVGIISNIINPIAFSNKEEYLFKVNGNSTISLTKVNEINMYENCTLEPGEEFIITYPEFSVKNLEGEIICERL